MVCQPSVNPGLHSLLELWLASIPLKSKKESVPLVQGRLLVPMEDTYQKVWRTCIRFGLGSPKPKARRKPGGCESSLKRIRRCFFQVGTGAREVKKVLKLFDRKQKSTRQVVLFRTTDHAKATRRLLSQGLFGKPGKFRWAIWSGACWRGGGRAGGRRLAVRLGPSGSALLP